jgi:aminoglycoside 3-N-acetyltransferase
MNDLEKIIKSFNFKNGDKILINSNLLKIFIKFKKNKKKFDPNFIIDSIIDKIGKKGTLLIPAYNWDFCKGLGFDYFKSKSLSGSLGNIALKRKEFKRSKNPIYSFLVFGNDQDLICEMKHESCFGLDSPFGYLINNNGKNLFIDIDYKDALTLCHVAEEKIGVDYRYFKKFEGDYFDKNGKKLKHICKMYVRDVKKTKSTGIHPKLDNILKSQNAFNYMKIEDYALTVIDIKKTYNIMLEDLKNKSKIIYPNKI